MATEREKLHGIRVNALGTIDFVPLEDDVVVGANLPIWDASNPTLTPVNYVEDSVVREIKSAFDGDNNLKADDLLKMMRLHHEGVDEQWFARAVSLVTMEPLEPPNDGEMVLQQSMYTPFSTLLLSMNTRGYLADQTWRCPIQVIVRDAYGDVSSKPDAASTHSSLGGTSRAVSAGDILTGEVEIKPSVHANTGLGLHMGDIAKCVLTTSCSALVMLKYGVPWQDIAVPFLAACGNTMLLGVSQVRENGHPWCKTIFDGDVSSMYRKQERLSTFACLALLVAKQHGATKKINEVLARKIIAEQGRRGASGGEGDGSDDSTAVKEVGKFTTSTVNKRRASSSTTANKQAKKTGGKGKQRSSEALAMYVASFGGEIVGLQSMWLPKLNLDDIFKHLPYDVPDKTMSPFYFEGQLAKDEKNKVFCKVWRQGDPLTPPAETVQEEIRMIQLAHQCGVPVPKIWSEFSCANLNVEDTLFHVVVLSFLDGKSVALTDLGLYTLSLVKAVRALHQCSVLHCDLKPSNILWVPSAQQAYLVDFGHAQLREGATGYRATKAFEAPEIATGEPHSRASDAYCVGVTILAEIDRLQIGRSHWLCDVARQLSAAEKCDRIALSEAELLIEGALRGPFSEGCEVTKNRELVVPPEGRIEHGSRGRAKVARRAYLASAH
jgi:hypothetical protein